LKFKKNIDLTDEPFFDKSYPSLYVDGESSLFEFYYEKGDFYFSTLAIKKPITKIGEEELCEEFYDLETAYGYGGAFSNTGDTRFLSKALVAYSNYCHEQKIVAEFIRFHPFNFFYQYKHEYFDFLQEDRQTVVVDLTLSKKDRWKDYGSNVRNILRKCEKRLEYNTSENLEAFIDLYYQTMDKNKADKFYFFDESYFMRLLKLPYTRLVSVSYQGKVVAMSFLLMGKKMCYYHLSANSEESMQLNANYFLLDRSFDLVKSEGRHLFYLGGGRTTTKEDSLFSFKKKFSKKYCPFYIAGKIHNKEKYQQLCSLWESQNTNTTKSMFLKYRIGS